MNADEIRPGVRVTWAKPLTAWPGSEIGVILQPTGEDLAYFADHDYPANRNVLVEWNGADWDTAWHEPAELAVVEP